MQLGELLDRIRDYYLQRLRAECIDDEQWRQEYCCEPANANGAFLSYDLLASCEESDVLKDFKYLQKCENPLFLGMDVAIAACLTCCCALLPVVMQTALQPLFYFERAWSLFLLRQLGYDLVSAAA